MRGRGEGGELMRRQVYGRRLSALVVDQHSLDMSPRERRRQHALVDQASGFQTTFDVEDAEAEAEDEDVEDAEDAADAAAVHEATLKDDWVRFGDRGSALLVQVDCPQVAEG
jgi:hypothetical protein